MKKVTVGIIGCGTIANGAHIPAYMKNEDVEIKYFCDIIPERAKAAVEKYGCGIAVEDYHRVLEDPEVEAISVCTPNRMHAIIAIDAMRAGKHVLCEKPAASNAAELQRMRAAAENGQAVLLEAMRSVYDPGFQAIEANLYRLGKIRSVSFRFCQYSSRYDNFRKGIIENAFRPELSNGALMDIGVYCVHPLVRLFGMPEKIEGASVFLENGVDGMGTILAQYPGWQAVLQYSKITSGYTESEVQGENGSMQIDRIADTRKITIHERTGRRDVILIPKEENNMVYEIREWLRLIENSQEDEKSKIYEEASGNEMQFLDLAREKMGIRFPADVS